MEYTINDFANFVSQQSVIHIAIGTLIGVYLNTLILEFGTAVTEPIVNNLVGNVYVATPFGAKLQITKLVQIAVQFFIMICVIYIIFRLIPRQINKII